MLHLILNIYSLFIVIQLAIIDVNGATFNFTLTRSISIFLIIPVIYYLIKNLFVKTKSDLNRALKIYSFAYVCFYVLWCLADIVYFALNMGHISGYMAYMLYLAGMLCIAPVLYNFADNIFLKSKTPRYIFFAYIVLIFILSFIPEILNKSGFYGVISK